MKKIIALTLVILLGGCTDRLDGHEIQPGVEFCKERKGVSFIRYRSVVQATTDTVAQCINGESTKY